MLLILLSLLFLQSTPPEWVSSFGSNTTYSATTWLTGFGMMENRNRTEALEQAKSQAAADLSQKVRASISSSFSSYTADLGNKVISEARMVNEMNTQLEIEGLEFDIHTDRNTVFALAKVRRAQAQVIYQKRAADYKSKAELIEKEAQAAEANGKLADAIKLYLQSIHAYDKYVQDASLAEAVGGAMAMKFMELNKDGKTFSLPEYQAKIHQKVASLSASDSKNVSEAIQLLRLQLDQLDMLGGRFTVTDLTYQDTPFSSVFGRYAKQELSQSFNRQVQASKGAFIIKGSYWPQDELVQLRLFILTSKGELRGSLSGSFQKSALDPSYSLIPQNLEQALVQQQIVDANAITDGGIHLEVWTNKGKEHESNVFEAGEEVSLYFKVNQPAYLQLTYVLSSGEKVLLEQAYYIGMDRVNHVVKYPDEFEVSAPFGIERLIVTAQNEKPPTPRIVYKKIDGVEYPLLADELSTYIVNHRGLKKKSSGTVRTGETVLTLTTIPKLR